VPRATRRAYEKTLNENRAAGDDLPEARLPNVIAKRRAALPREQGLAGGVRVPALTGRGRPGRTSARGFRAESGPEQGPSESWLAQRRFFAYRLMRFRGHPVSREPVAFYG